MSDASELSGIHDVPNIREPAGASEAEVFWRKTMSGLTRPPRLPLPKPEGPSLPSRGDVELTLSPATSRALAIFASESGVSMRTLAHGVWALVLARYTGVSDVVFAAADGLRRNRTHRPTEGQPSGAILQRVRIEDDATVRDWLRAIQAERDRLRLAPRAPVSDVERWAGWEEDTVESRLEYREFSFASEEPGDRWPGRFPLALRVEGCPALRLRLSFDGGRYSEMAARRLLEHAAGLAGRFLENPTARLAEIDMLLPDERRRILVEWNDTARDYPRDRCAHELIETAGDHDPSAPAVSCGETVLTWAEFEAASNRLAHRLRALGVGPDVPVGVLFERSPGMAIAVLGILKAGGAYLPIDPGSPAERTAFMLTDAKVPVVVCPPELADRLPAGTPARVLALDADLASLSGEPATRPAPLAKPEHLAYVIYTSGSTGKPKGVLIPHRGLVNYLAWSARAYGAAAGEGAPVHSPLVFDLTVTSFLTPLSAGRPVAMIPDREGVDGLAAALRARKNWSLVKITPAHLEILASQLSPSDAADCAKTFVIGGEALRGETLAFWVKSAPASRFVNEYGPTETVVGCCVHTVTAADWAPGPVPIGRPIANTRLYVLDAAMRPVPAGVPGELYIGGDGLARGYLGRPDLTEKSFVANPLPEESGSRLYRTGDRVRHRPDGVLEYLGRADDQVKIRGYRIELGEIESVLARHPAVRQAAVVAAPGASGELRLVGYFSADGEYAPRREELREFLGRSLPPYMIPAGFVEMDELPLTTNGKIDRRALPAADIEEDAASASGRAPGTPTEKKVAEIWSEVLGIPDIGVEKDFFALGGHSVLAARIFAKIEGAFGARLPLAVLLQAPTIARLSEAIDGKKWESAWSSLVPLQPNGTKPPLYCIHPIGGNVVGYVDLARRLGDDQPLYGLQAVGLDGQRPRHKRIEDMADHYVGEILEFQPQGPYYLAGSSFGGTIAFEMAQRIRAKGGEVAFLGMFDTWGPDYRRKPEMTGWRLTLERNRRRIELHVGNFLASEGLSGKLGYLRTKAGRLGHNVAHQFGMKWKKLRSRRAPAALSQTLAAVERSAVKAKNVYAPKPYEGKITLFRASRQPGWFYPDPRLGWGRLAAGGLEILEVPGYHGALTHEPRVAVLAEELESCLSRIRSGTAPGSPAADPGGDART